MKTYVLDASALMSFFEDSAGAAKVEELLRKAAEANQFLLLSVVNWGEVYYALWRIHGESVANHKLLEIAQLPIELIDADTTMAKVAATLKATLRLPYADCFAAAIAQLRRATVVTTDRDFVKAEKIIDILWARDR